MHILHLTLEILQGKIHLLPLHQDVFFSYYKFIFLKGNITYSKLGKIHATDTAYIVYFISSVT
jgi:hypothetical protein